MRVTLVTETYFPQLNGVSRTLGKLIEFLGEVGDDIQLVHPDYGIRSGPDDVVRVRSTTLPFYRELHLPIPPFRRVHRAIAGFRPDVIHIATEATLGLSVLRYARTRRIPVVSSFHTNFDQYSAHYGVGWARNLIWRYLRWFHNRTRETYVPSRTTIAQLEQKGFERLVLWPRGVDSRLFHPARPERERLREGLGFGRGDVVIGYVSRLAAEKNVDYLGAVLRRVAEQRPATGFLFVGDGPSRQDLERQMAGTRAHFVGYQSGERLADYYSACDLFAFSSLTETFGNVVLEAMASGLPVVALRAGGVGEIVRSGSTGILGEPADPPERMAEALVRLIDDVDLRRTMARGARDHALSQSWSAIMTGLRASYVRSSQPTGTQAVVSASQTA